MGSVSGEQLEGVGDRRGEGPEAALDGSGAPWQHDHQGAADAPRKAPGKHGHRCIPETLGPQQFAVTR